MKHASRSACHRRNRRNRLAALCAVAFFGGTFSDAADPLQSKSTYAKSYGATKAAVEVDPAKDLPRYPAVEPKDAIATWKIKPGFRLKLAAHEPQVRDPIAVSFDERGRMFVVEMNDYSELRDVTPHLGRVSMLEDKDGDGYYETSTVFADDLPWPTGVICANGGIYVIATPDVYFFKDTKGTGKADIREVVFTGFGTGLKLLNVQGLANCPQWGLDNRIHIQAGGGNRGVVTRVRNTGFQPVRPSGILPEGSSAPADRMSAGPSGRMPEFQGVELGGKDFWFDPRTYEFGLEAGGGQYGMSFDDYGRKFACSNSDHLQYFVYDDRYAARNPFFSMPSPRQSIAADGGAAEVYRISPDEPWRIVRTRWRVAGVVKGMVEGGGRVSGYFTGATGTTVYRGDAYGDEFKNNTFTGDAGGQLIHRKKIYADGVSLTGKRPDDEQNFEFAASKDTWVRVVNFANAPDGCLHVMDMYREVIEHPWSIPDEIKKHLDLNSGNDRGRIYRIEPDSGPPSPLGAGSSTQGAASSTWQRRTGSAVRPGGKSLADMSTAELVATLEHPNGWHRDTAARLLYERQDKSAVPLLAKLVSESPSPVAKIHAFAALLGFGELSEAIVLQALSDGDEHVRESGLVYSERLFSTKYRFGSDALRNAYVHLATDPSVRVRFQLVLTLGRISEFARGLSGGSNKAQLDITGQLVFLAEIVRKAIAAGDANQWVEAAAAVSPHPLANRLLESFSKDAADKQRNRHLERQLFSAVSAGSSPFERKMILDWVSREPSLHEFIPAIADGFRRAGTMMAKVDTENKLGAVFSKAADTVCDAKSADSARIEAMQLVSLDAAKQAVPALLACLEKSQPEAVQSAGVTALAQFAGKDVTDALIAHWPDFSRKARTAAFAALLARPERATALLHSIEGKKIAANELAASDVQALFKHKDASVAKLADTVLAELKPASRESVIAKFKPALAAKGDAARGQQIYAQRCISCHRVGGQGIQLGPDLVTVKTKGRDGILTAILEPNKEVAPQFIAYTVNTKDGQTFMGFIAKDDASGLTLKMIGGAEQTIPRNQIKGTSSSGLSLMPEGIEAGMDVQAMADLLTFIEELK